MMKCLQSDTEAAIDYLKQTVQNMMLSNFDGENVNKAVSLLRSAAARFTSFDANRTLPPDFLKWVVKVLHTSSVPDFNSLFALME
jgi:hypothetical protein